MRAAVPITRFIIDSFGGIPTTPSSFQNDWTFLRVVDRDL
jgi:hypothetical protein